mmetsp:Transcript_117997/g.328844  ORF Transcript_117997/g.328844 Transcript_117997/m.328844 type:complete len:228 (+) Transcript_117997:863-1546(+)
MVLIGLVRVDVGSRPEEQLHEEEAAAPGGDVERHLPAVARANLVRGPRLQEQLRGGHVRGRAGIVQGSEAPAVHAVEHAGEQLPAGDRGQGLLELRHVQGPHRVVQEERRRPHCLPQARNVRHVTWSAARIVDHGRVGTGLHEELADGQPLLGLLILGQQHVERGVPTEHVSCVDVRAGLNQHLSGLDVAPQGGDVQRRPTCLVGPRGIAAHPKQLAYLGDVVRTRG